MHAMKENTTLKTTKDATKFGVTLFQKKYGNFLLMESNKPAKF